MSKDKTTNATNWLHEGALNNSIRQLDKTKEALQRGSTENAQTHLLNALDSLRHVQTLVISDDFVYPNLTAEENNLYRGLCRMKDYANFSRVKLGLKVESEIERLRKKAWGEE